MPWFKYLDRDQGGLMNMVTIFLVAFALMFPSITYPQTATIPQRTSDNIIVASYNIKWLGQSKHDLQKLATVIQHFDVCGILEVKKEAEVAKLANALKALTSKDWGFSYGVRTHRPGFW